MSTSALIGKERSNGMVEYVYCNFDGYLEGVGTMLQNYTSEDFDYLLEGGDVSCIDYCAEDSEFYRDRGEKDIDSKIVAKDKYIDCSGTNFNVYYRYLYTKDTELVCYKGEPYKNPDIVKL